MAVVIGQIVTETALSQPPTTDPSAASGSEGDAQIDLIVRRATERVLETLRRDWDR